MAVTTGQPQKLEMMPPAPGTINTPQGLAYLASLDQIIVKQKNEIHELMLGFEARNQYRIVNSINQPIFFAKEDSPECGRLFWPCWRGFKLRFRDNNKQEVMRISREFKYCQGCCWCADCNCGMVLTIEAPVGRVVGTIRQSTSKCQAHIKLFDADDQHLFTIWGPCCPCQAVCCRNDVNFPITDPSLQTKIGNITKQWRGCCTESFTDADQFCLTFPPDMSIDNKCILIGSVFLVEFLEFESDDNK